jgi:hypothetical protein
MRKKLHEQEAARARGCTSETLQSSIGLSQQFAVRKCGRRVRTANERAVARGLPRIRGGSRRQGRGVSSLVSRWPLCWQCGNPLIQIRSRLPGAVECLTGYTDVGRPYTVLRLAYVLRLLTFAPRLLSRPCPNRNLNSIFMEFTATTKILVSNALFKRGSLKSSSLTYSHSSPFWTR